MDVVGWSHRQTALPLLERVAVDSSERPDLLARLQAAGCAEAVVLSTCSRTEVYSVAGPVPVDVLRLVAEHRRCAPDELEAVVVRASGQVALEHLFAVTAGLESRLVGEPEVCGQVRRAAREACRAGTAGRELVPAFSAAVRCARRVRDVTSLGGERQSWGHRAVSVGLAHGGRYEGAEVVVVGAGRMAAEVVAHLRRRGLHPQVLARDLAAAARLGGAAAARPFSDLEAALATADLVLLATAARAPLLTASQVARSRAGRASGLTLVDLAVPRAVAADVALVPGVRLLGVEALGDDWPGTSVAAGVEVAQAMVRAEVQRYLDAVAARRAGPLIAALRRSVEQVCLEELARTASSRTGTEELSRVAHVMSGRLMHRTTAVARAAAVAGDTAVLALLADVFCLPETPLERRSVTGRHGASTD